MRRIGVCATGDRREIDRHPDLPGVEGAVKRSLVRICPICDGYEATDKAVAVIGDGDRRAREAAFISTERMNRTIKDATVKVFHYDDTESLKAHVLAFVTAYNFAKPLKALRWKTPYQAICDA